MKPKHSCCSLFLIFQMQTVLVLCALLGAVASAQSGHGTISGRAVDMAGAVLDGARVRLQPGDIVTATDGRGEFNFIGLAPGNYTLTISYVGFKDFTKQVTIAAGKADHIEAKMDVSGKSEEVTVIADRPHGEAEAINRQRTSDNILQVLPSDVITALPNANIADAVGRLPSVTLERDEGEGKYVQIRGTEPRLNNVTIDGITIPAPESSVRQVKLDTIPADIVESVEVNKTLSANQDAEAIGGTVNLVTKTAGDLPTLTLGVIGGFTPILNTRAIAQVNGTIGQRFGVSKKFGALFSGSFDYNGRGIDDIEPSPDTGQLTPPLYDSIDLREYRYKRKRYGFGGSLDYKLGDGAGLYLHYFYSDFRDYGDKWVYTLNDGTGCTGDATTAVPCPPPQFSGSERAPDYRIGNVAIGGKHIFANSWLAWNLSTSASLQTAAAGNPGFDFQYNGPVTANGQSVGPPLCTNIPATNPHLPQWSPACTAPGSPVYDPTQWSLLDIDTTSGNTSQVNLAGAISYAQNYHLGKHNSTFEFGFKVRNDHKGQNAYSPVYDNPSPAAPLMTQYLSGFTNPNYYFNDYRLGPVVSWPSITGSLPNLVSQGILTLDSGATHLGSDASNFELTERISAAYVMNTIESGRFRLQTGFRIEATQLNTLGYIVTNDASGNWLSTAPFPANTWYWDPLPSVQLRYRLDDDSDLRAVYGRGISRPNPYDTIPYVELDESTNPYTVSLGNPNLKPEHANSYDLLYERYLKPFGEIQAGFFYKQLSSPIYYTNALAVNTGTYAGDNISQIINGSNARLLGFEVAYIQHLGFLPGVLSGTGISANYSWTTSNSGSLPGRTDTPALQRQAPNTWNISPTYDRGRFSTRAGLSYNGASIFQYQWQTGAGVGGTAGPAGDTYFYPHLQVDAQASYRVRKDLTFLVQGLNLTNEVFGFYNGSPQYVLQREYYNRTYSFGLRWEPRREY
jgi:TonB-dependent receptor